MINVQIFHIYILAILFISCDNDINSNKKTMRFYSNKEFPRFEIIFNNDPNQSIYSINDLEIVKLKLMYHESSTHSFTISDSAPILSDIEINWFKNDKKLSHLNENIFYDDPNVGMIEYRVNITRSDTIFSDTITVKVDNHIKEFRNGYYVIPYSLNDLFAIDHADHIWISANSSIIEINGSNVINHIFKNEKIYLNEIIIDDNNTLWLRTGYNSSVPFLTFFKENTFQTISLEGKIPDINTAHIHNVIKDIHHQNQLIISTHYGQLYYFNTQTYEVDLFAPQPKFQNEGKPIDLKFSESGELWYTQKFVTAFLKNNQWQTIDTIAHPKNIAFSGQTTFISQIDGIYIIDSNSTTFISTLGSMLENDIITTIATDQNGKIYIGSFNTGMFTIENNKFVQLSEFSEFKFIAQIQFTSENKIVFTSNRNLVIEQ